MTANRRPILDARVVIVGTIGFALIVFYVVLAARAPAGLSPFSNRTDTLAFYCGARVASAHRDPYRAEPLRTCEDDAMRTSGVEPIPNLLVPAPLPGYALAMLSPLALLPYPAALAVWYFTLLGAVVVTSILLARMTQLRPFPIFVALFGADAYASVTLGQLVPLVLLALVASAAALRANRPRRAACFAALALVEPHVGIAAVLALATFVPRTRFVLALAAVAFAALSLATLGFAENLEYFVAALPAQARGEGLEFHRQYSLSALVHAFGLSADAALRVGSLSYAIALACGLELARRARRRFEDPAMVVFVPIAAVLVGGTYAHIAQMALALPLAFALVAATRGATRRWAVAATASLAIPWQTIFSEGAIAQLFPAPPYVDPTPLLAHVSQGSRLASDAWDAWISTISNRDHRTTLEVLVGKLPTWFGLGTLLALSARLATKKESDVRRGSGFENTTMRSSRRARSLRSN